MAIEMTLAERVLALVRDPSDAVLTESGRQPVCAGDEFLSEYELDLREWGVFYGLAVGLARLEEPCESTGRVARRALVAAQEAFAEYSDGFHRRPPFRDEREAA